MDRSDLLSFCALCSGDSHYSALKLLLFLQQVQCQARALTIRATSFHMRTKLSTKLVLIWTSQEPSNLDIATVPFVCC